MLMVKENEWLHCTLDRSMSVQSFLDFYCISEKKRKQWLDSGEILLNRKMCQATDCMMKHDELSLHCFEAIQEPNPAIHSSLVVLAEDDFVLVADKPAGIIIHSDQKEETLNQQVESYYLQKGYNLPVRHLHRLDKETTGCVLYSQCEFFQPFLDDLMRQKKIHREYIAVVEGIIPWDKKTVNVPIGKDRHHNQRQRVSKTGKDAITHIDVLKRNPKLNITLICCRLETGRTHQIRVHMQHLRFPLVADELYGKKSKLISHCALHAYKLVWTEPITLKEKEVISEIPDEIRALF